MAQTTQTLKLTRYFEPKVPDDLTSVQQEQLVAAGTLYFGKRIAAEKLMAPGNPPESSFYGHLEVREIIDSNGRPAFTALSYMGDSGTVFRAGGTVVIAQILQDGLECEDPEIEPALDAVLHEKMPAKTIVVGGTRSPAVKPTSAKRAAKKAVAPEKPAKTGSKPAKKGAETAAKKPVARKEVAETARPAKKGVKTAAKKPAAAKKRTKTGGKPAKKSVKTAARRALTPKKLAKGSKKLAKTAARPAKKSVKTAAKRALAPKKLTKAATGPAKKKTAAKKTSKAATKTPKRSAKK